MRFISTSDPGLDFDDLLASFSCRVSCLPSGTRVVVTQSSNSLLAASILALWHRNCIAIPVDQSLGKQHLYFVAKHSQASAIIQGTHLHFIGHKHLSPLTDAFMIYTSGTTGSPKAVVLSRSAIESNALAMAKENKFSSNPHFSALPLFHVNALFMSLMGVALADGCFICSERFSPERDFKIMSSLKCSTASLVPSLIKRLLNQQPKWPDSLEYIITAAAPLSSTLASAFYKLYGPRLRQGYGLSESTNFSFLMPLLDSISFIKEYCQQQPPVGLPLAGTHFRIINGEVQLKGPYLMNGYWANPAATDSVYDEGWLQTGDLGIIRNNYLVLTGRKKEIILRGGESISPYKIEELICQNNSDLVPVVAAISSEAMGDDIGLVIDGEDRDVSSLDQLPTRLRPRWVGFIPIKRTSTGKPQRELMFKNIGAFDLPVDCDLLHVDKYYGIAGRHAGDTDPWINLKSDSWESAISKFSNLSLILFFDSQSTSHAKSSLVCDKLQLGGYLTYGYWVLRTVGHNAGALFWASREGLPPPALTFGNS